MFPAALGHGGGSCRTTGAGQTSGVEEGAAHLDVEREGAAGGKDTVLVSDTYTRGELRAYTSNMKSPSLFFCMLGFFKFLIQLKVALSFFVVAAVVCSLYMLSDPLKTHTKLGPLFYWVLLKCPPMPQ